MKKIRFINSEGLKLLAMLFMLLDHLWATLVSGNQWMNYVGRLAFPIFAFLIAEGYSHTSNVKKYAKRLLLFGLISEIPFDLMCTGTFFFPFHQNVMFTLLLGLLCINEIEKLKKAVNAKGRVVCLLKMGLFLLVGTVGFVDYGAMGILVVIAFYVFRNFKLEPLFQLLSLVLLFWVFFKGMGIVIPLGGRALFLPVQAFGILSLIPIWLYNGKKGSGSKAVKYAFYAFYPVHMALIYVVYALFF